MLGLNSEEESTENVLLVSLGFWNWRLNLLKRGIALMISGVVYSGR